MLFRELLIEELNARRRDFAVFAENWHDELADYLQLLAELSKMTSDGVRRKLGKKENVGALPSNELDFSKSLTVRFEPRWHNHEEARRWALNVLQNRTTFAADASQILPGRDISLPVAAVQVGTFENPHTSDGDYKKAAKFVLIPPNELLQGEGDDEKPINAETVVGLRRFAAEVEAVKEFLSRQQGWRERGERMPLAFFDGTLLVSISLPRTKIQERFITQTVELVRLSEETEVPLVGFVDHSYARDIINLLDELNSANIRDNTGSRNLLHKERTTLYDAQLLNAKPENGARALQFWGDRTIFNRCQRHGLSDYLSGANGTSLIGFVYLQTTGDGIPARLDVPSWIYKSGLLDELVDAVRAECVIGLGYPYALETADATAVITSRDREMFLRALQEFSARENLNFTVANKRISKARRR